MFVEEQLDRILTETRRLLFRLADARLERVIAGLIFHRVPLLVVRVQLVLMQETLAAQLTSTCSEQIGSC